jgi:hypothetical protein
MVADEWANKRSAVMTERHRNRIVTKDHCHINLQMLVVKIWIARIIGAGATLVGGATLQILLWKSPSVDYWNALCSHPYLWPLYVLVGLFLGEHALKWMQRH